MNKSFIFYNDPPSWTDCQNFRQLSFRLKLVLYVHFERHVVVKKNDVTPPIVNVTMPYVIDDVMKIKLATEWLHAGPYPARAVIY